MIIQIGTDVDESRILWKYKESDEWKRADIDDLIRAYEKYNQLTTIDLVRCKDCYNNVPQDDDVFTWCNYFCDYVRLEHYCSYGERIEE